MTLLHRLGTRLGTGGKASSAAITAPNWPLAERLWREHIREHRAKLLLALVAVAFVAASTSLYPVLINWAFQALDQRSSWAISTLPWLVLVASAVRGASTYSQVALTQQAVTQVEADMQARLYRHLVDADLTTITEHSPAAWTQRFTTDLVFVRNALTRLANILIREGITIIALFATMIYLDWVLSLVVFVILPFALVPISQIGKRLRRVSRRTQERTGDMASLTVETFGAARVVKTYRLEAYLGARADESFGLLKKLRYKSMVQKARIEPLMECLGGIAVALVLTFVGWRIMSGQSSVGEFSGFLGALLIASQPLRALGNLSTIVQEGMAALQRYYAVIDEPVTVRDRPAATPAHFGADAVRLERVSFSYGDSAPALFDVSFEAAAGETTAIVGRSGAGKSTVFNLIPRLYDPSAGRVVIGGEDIAGLTLASLRDRIAIVSQDVVVFNDTVGANIALGRPGAPASAIEEAARLAGAHDFIMRDPLGYDAPAGERGANFSGGERQRIALARAFLKNAPILLLDEATSALDAESEQIVRDALARLTEGRTTLVIAHRLATVRAAEKIVVMDAGRVAEVGTHDALVAAGGLYAKFHKLQLAAD
ncbi:ABC transporter ATP-binding protein [Acuticoccus sp. I52.16.1]|uniref:ABC transporter ATP-binding protein n=1 Tax=Acuticoccus sp. I52.16.1 TaxID=2928472 RepID=UPI001FD02223|nr:ABC transporter ATP-binding protein [Acuticoccus sp. I52.16.1]UOM33381.1 ABC transporter ATP-binding protein/permease [Acuticoccus sp. I52.16.1]